MMWRPISVLLLGLALSACGEQTAQQPAATPAVAGQPTPVTAATPAPPAEPAQGAQPAQDAGRGLSLANNTWKGDFDRMIQRRMIRVLVPYSRTLYYVDKGRERGVTADLVRDFERHLNRKYAKSLSKRPVTVYFVVTTPDRLLTELNEGLGDIAAGNLTVTAGRLELVDFVVFPDSDPVQELIVTGPASPMIQDILSRKLKKTAGA